MTLPPKEDGMGQALGYLSIDFFPMTASMPLHCVEK